MKPKQFLWLAPLGAFTLGIAVTLMVNALAVQTDQAVIVLLSLVVGLLGVSFGLVSLTAVILQVGGDVISAAQRSGRPRNDTETADGRASGKRPPMVRRVPGSRKRFEEQDASLEGPADRTAVHAGRGAGSGPTGRSYVDIEEGTECANTPGAKTRAQDVETRGMEESDSRDRSTLSLKDPARVSSGDRCRDGSTWTPSVADREPRDPEAAAGGMHSAAPTLDPGSLIEVWDRYLSQGDGHFDASGLQEQLEAVGVEGGVVAGHELGVGDVVLGVYGPEDAQRLYLLPNFSYSPGAVAEWFVDEGSGGRNAMIQRLNQVAVVRRVGQGIELVQQGAVA